VIDGGSCVLLCGLCGKRTESALKVPQENVLDLDNCIVELRERFQAPAGLIRSDQALCGCRSMMSTDCQHLLTQVRLLS
jgi:hypothetical protein